MNGVELAGKLKAKIGLLVSVSVNFPTQRKRFTLQLSCDQKDEKRLNLWKRLLRRLPENQSFT